MINLTSKDKDRLIKIIKIYTGKNFKELKVKFAWDEYKKAYAVALRVKGLDFILYNYLSNTQITEKYVFDNLDEAEFESWPPTVSQKFL